VLALPVKLSTKENKVKLSTKEYNSLELVHAECEQPMNLILFFAKCVL